jgi:hypothetical protein
MAAKEAFANVSEGVHVGTASTALVGFWGVTPVVQPAASAYAAVSTTAPINSSASATCFGFTSADAAGIKTLVNGLRAMGVTAGLWST